MVAPLINAVHFVFRVTRGPVRRGRQQVVWPQCPEDATNDTTPHSQSHKIKLSEMQLFFFFKLRNEDGDWLSWLLIIKWPLVALPLPQLHLTPLELFRDLFQGGSLRLTLRSELWSFYILKFLWSAEHRLEIQLEKETIPLLILLLSKQKYDQCPVWILNLSFRGLKENL